MKAVQEQECNRPPCLYTFYKRMQIEEPEQKLAAAEETSAYHTVRYSVPFLSIDYSTSLIQIIFEPKLFCRSIKT